MKNRGGSREASTQAMTAAQWGVMGCGESQRTPRQVERYQGSPQWAGVKGKVSWMKKDAPFTLTPAVGSYLQIHVDCTDGHLGALSVDGLLVFPEHLLSGQA